MKKHRGKGKHNKGTQRVTFNVSCQPEERDLIKQKADEQKVSVSRLIVDAVLNKKDS